MGEENKGGGLRRENVTFGGKCYIFFWLPQYERLGGRVPKVFHVRY